MFTSEFNERSRSDPLCDFRLGTVATSDRETPLTKSAVAMLKKGDWHERGPVTDQGHDRSGRPGKKRDHELERGPSGRRSPNARQLGCVFQDMKPP